MLHKFEPWAFQKALEESGFAPTGETQLEQLNRLGARAEELTRKAQMERLNREVQARKALINTKDEDKRILAKLRSYAMQPRMSRDQQKDAAGLGISLKSLAGKVGGHILTLI